MTKNIALGLGAFILVIFTAAVSLERPIGWWLYQRAIEQKAGRDLLGGLEDGLHLGLCGTGSPMPNPQRAGPCNVIIAGDQAFVVDIGEGGNRVLNLMGINPAMLNGVLITHFHSDHIDGLGPLMLFHWTRGATTSPLPIHGPTGVETIVDGFNTAYATDDTYRTAHHGEEVAPASGGGAVAFPFELTGSYQIILEEDDLTITAFRVNHAPIDPAVGYRFDYKGRAICISGDTSQSANLESVCNNVDIIVHDALQPLMVEEMRLRMEDLGNPFAARIFHDIQDYHASPEEAAESAQTAGAKMLVLSHLVPPLPSEFLYAAFLGDAESRFDGPIVVGEDGMLFFLPADGESIHKSNTL
ncbi:MAG: MBL fold metallo-hydrolase [Maricaulis sp.]|uniref:MBL fold metallo-hydrolase n=1 Tax=Maricaulis sp. TaxID=1486257 RepID=UPI001B1B174B|nr:MBL fold metallo-hydrolase [Maricaulis sp.]MBO6729085.1 MBL fold metallo-hydrolase [Maricaulis sp.]MBO6878359.1 MBL fold metallo-hydrolase [Maricaulis sp.]